MNPGGARGALPPTEVGQWADSLAPLRSIMLTQTPHMASQGRAKHIINYDHYDQDNGNDDAAGNVHES